MTENKTRYTLKSLGIDEFIRMNGIDLSEIEKIKGLKPNAHRFRATAELFMEKGIERYSALELGAIVWYPKSDLKVLKNRSKYELQYMFHEQRSLLQELSLPYAQFLRMATAGPKNNLLHLLGYKIKDFDIVKKSNPIYRFTPSQRDWIIDTSLPHPINSNSSFGLGVLWRNGVVKSYDPPELRIEVYASHDQREKLTTLNKVLNKMFNIEFILSGGESEKQFCEDATLERSGLRLHINSLAIGTFLSMTAGLPIGNLYSESRVDLPKLRLNEKRFLEGYDNLMKNSKKRWHAVTSQLRDNIIVMLNRNGYNAVSYGSASEHCYLIKLN